MGGKEELGRFNFRCVSRVLGIVGLRCISIAFFGLGLEIRCSIQLSYARKLPPFYRALP